MNVLIVARTKMSGGRRCIGGISQGGHSVRLLTSNGDHWNTNCSFQIGQVWDVSYIPSANLVPPHVEDVLVIQSQYLNQQQNLRAHLVQRVAPWRGGINQLFGGVLGYTSNDNGFVSRLLGVPIQSTGFWIPDKDLSLRDDGKHYDYRQQFVARGLSYVGESGPIPVIPRGTLVRVSLARWWRPAEAGPELEERCYLQLSGWYL